MPARPANPAAAAAAAAASGGAVGAVAAALPRTDARPDTGPAEGFGVVGLGGSAGSLAGLEQFFGALPADCGLAFVVVTHLSPEHESGLATVLQHFTSLPVFEITDGLRLRPNAVYVIPPNRDLSLLHGALLLFEPTQPKGRRLPIDFFFQSLAKDARERAVAIVFSGMGSDGAVGVKVVMENFGMVMAQEPAAAEYPSMPQAAIATGFVDYALPADQLPARLLAYVRRPLLARARPATEAAAGQPDYSLHRVFALIREQTGHDFSPYKRNTVLRRIERRMNALRLPDFARYVQYLHGQPPEVEALFRELLIGVTKFFRDPAAFAALAPLLAARFAEKEPRATVRVWAPGCSTGEEAYSLAMLLLEEIEAQQPRCYLRLQLFATDLNPDGVAQARTGRYPANIVADVSPERLRRFFIPLENGQFQVSKELRETVIFAPHDLNKDAPFTRLDLLVCRNLLIYFGLRLQRGLIPLFHYALAPGGLLFLGPSESLNGFTDLFDPLDAKWKIFRRTAAVVRMARVRSQPFVLPLPAAVPATPLPPPVSPASFPSLMDSALTRKDPAPFAALVQHELLRTFVPAAVVIEPKGLILYVHGRTGRYLAPAPGPGTLNVFDMALPELQHPLARLAAQAQAAQQPVLSAPLAVPTATGPQRVRLHVQPLAEPGAAPGGGASAATWLLVVFEELSPLPPVPVPARRGGAKTGAAQAEAEAAATEAAAQSAAAVAAIGQELSFTRHRLQTTIEELESSVEELRSTNEELQSTNEELQSTNEESMTNKEEMQSLNEELLTLNTQHQSKTEELGQAANDIKNLLDATGIATIFLDNDLLIKRYTPSIGHVLPLQPSDVGRSISHFAASLNYEQLGPAVQQVLDRLTPHEANVQVSAGDWFALRILPYRTLDNYISGAVLTFANITPLKTLEAQLQRTTAFAESIIATMPEPVLILDANLRVVQASQAFATTFGGTVAGLRGQPLALLHDGAWAAPALRRHLLALLSPAAPPFDELPLETEFPDYGLRQLRLTGRCVLSEGVPTGNLLLSVRVG